MKVEFEVESGWDGVFIIVTAVNRQALGEEMKKTKLPFKWNARLEGYEVKYPECISALKEVFGEIPEVILEDAKWLLEHEI